MPNEAGEASEHRQIAVALTHCGAGILSFCGSGLLLTSLLVQSRRNQKRLRPFQRLLLGLSVYDLMHSAAVSFSTLPVRADANVWGAHGTIATCVAQGFFQQQAQAGFCYNAALAVYFLAVIRYGLKDKQIVPFEKCFHIIIFVALESLAVAGFFFEWYNPMQFPELGCWFGPWPNDCSGDTCERGEYSFWLSVFGAIIFQVLAFIIISVSNLLVYLKFKDQEQQMARYQGGGDNHFSREISIQGFLYSAAALNTVFWGFLSLFLGTFRNLGNGVLLFIAIMNAFMFPIQGFFTFLIYLRPIYKRARKNNPDCGRMKVVRIALFEDERTARQRSHTSRFTSTTAGISNAATIVEEQELASSRRTLTAANISNMTRVLAVPPEEQSPGCNDAGGGGGSIEEDTRTESYTQTSVRENGEEEAPMRHDERRTSQVRFADPD